MKKTGVRFSRKNVSECQFRDGSRKSVRDCQNWTKKLKIQVKTADFTTVSELGTQNKRFSKKCESREIHKFPKEPKLGIEAQKTEKIPDSARLWAQGEFPSGAIETIVFDARTEAAPPPDRPTCGL